MQTNPSRAQTYQSEGLRFFGLSKKYDAAIKRTTFVAECSCGKKEEVSLPPTIDPNIVSSSFAKKHWTIRGKSKKPICPTCCGVKIKTRSEEEVQTMKNTNTAAIAPTSVNHDDAQTFMTPNPKIARKVFGLLEEHFDEATRLYKPSWDDARIAKESNTAVEFVAKTRREGYGELAEEPALVLIREGLELLRMEYGERVEKMSKDFLRDYNALKHSIDVYSRKK